MEGKILISFLAFDLFGRLITTCSIVRLPRAANVRLELYRFGDLPDARFNLYCLLHEFAVDDRPELSF